MCHRVCPFDASLRSCEELSVQGEGGGQSLRCDHQAERPREGGLGLGKRALRRDIYKRMVVYLDTEITLQTNRVREGASLREINEWLHKENCPLVCIERGTLFYLLYTLSFLAGNLRLNLLDMFFSSRRPWCQTLGRRTKSQIAKHRSIPPARDSLF
jgi:hypothetical protein